MLEGDAREKVRRRAADWLKAHVARVLKPLYKALDAPLSGAPRGLVFQLAEGLGSLPRRQVDKQVKALSASDRKALARLGIRFGVESVFMPALLKAAPQRLRARLWTARTGAAVGPALPEGRTSLSVDEDVPAGFYEAVGFHVLGAKAVRVDMLERFAAELRRLSREKVAILPPGLLTLLGATVDEAPAVLAALGYEVRVSEDGIAFKQLPRRRPERGDKGPRRGKDARGKGKPGKGRQPSRKDMEDSPFAILRDLVTISA